MKVAMKALVVTPALLLLGSGPAAACWCEEATPQELFDDSDAVFSGVITSMVPGEFLGERSRYDLTVTAC